MQDDSGTPVAAAAEDSGAPDDDTRGTRFLALVGVGAVVLLADQASKAWALAHLDGGVTRPLLGDWLQLSLVRNSGAAFSFASGRTGILTAFAALITAWVLWVGRRVTNAWWALSLGLLLGGALGNLVDRFVREPGVGRGHVVDFIDYGGLFVGNVADIAIVVGAGIIAVLSARGIPLHKRPGAERG